MGDLSAHFSRSEFRCHHCGRLVLSKTLVGRLELLRAELNRPLVIVSGFRCAVHNAAVGGAPRSRHLYGDAVDFKPGVVPPLVAEKVGFRGIGVSRGWCVHADERPGRLTIFKD